MPAIKAVRCGLSRFTTIQHVPETRGEDSMECVRGAMRDRGEFTVDSPSSFKSKAMLASDRLLVMYGPPPWLQAKK
jgi:hypothetical protein